VFVELLVNVGAGVADAAGDFEVQAQADPEAQQYAEGDGGRGDNIYFIIPRGVDEVEGGPLPLRR
jgi:hypothetical protein